MPMAAVIMSMLRAIRQSAQFAKGSVYSHDPRAHSGSVGYSHDDQLLRVPEEKQPK